MSQIAVASPAKDRKRLTLAVEWAMTHQWLRAKTEPSRRTAGRRWLQKHSHDCLFLRSRIFGPSRFSVWMIKAGSPANSVQPCSSVGGSLNVGFWQKGGSSKIFWFMSMVAPCATLCSWLRCRSNRFLDASKHTEQRSRYPCLALLSSEKRQPAGRHGRTDWPSSHCEGPVLKYLSYCKRRFGLEADCEASCPNSWQRYFMAAENSDLSGPIARALRGTCPIENCW